MTYQDMLETALDHHHEARFLPPAIQGPLLAECWSQNLAGPCACEPITESGTLPDVVRALKEYWTEKYPDPLATVQTVMALLSAGAMMEVLPYLQRDMDACAERLQVRGMLG